MRLLTLLLGICLVGVGWTQAQSSQPFPLKGKRVAVYFSKKHFTFDDTYRIPLSQFIKSDAGKNAEIEDIKLQTSVALGSMFAKQLKAPAQADSVYFLNEFPDLANSFIDHYQSDDRSLEPLGGKFEGTDYILVLNPFILSSYKTSSVYSRSNRIITEQVVVKTARVRIELFEPRSGDRRLEYETCIDDRKTPVRHIAFEFHLESSRTGRFLAKLFTLAVENINTGVHSNCENE
jgi:hypothetical protein